MHVCSSYPQRPATHILPPPPTQPSGLTRLAIGEDGDVVPRQRRVQQLLDAAQRHHVALAGVGPQARVEAEIALHRGAAGAGDHHLGVVHVA